MCLLRVFQDLVLSVDVSIGPSIECRPHIVHDGPESAQSRYHDNGLFVDDVVFIADEICCNRSTGGDDGSLGDHTITRKSINQSLCLLGWRFTGDGDWGFVVGGITMGGQGGGNGRKRSS